MQQKRGNGVSSALIVFGLFLALVVAPGAYLVYPDRNIGGESVVAQSMIAVAIDGPDGSGPLTGVWLKVHFALTKIESYIRFDVASGSLVSDGSTLKDHLEVYMSVYEPSRTLAFIGSKPISLKSSINDKNIVTSMGNYRETASWLTNIPYKLSVSKNSVMLGQSIEMIGKEGLVEIADKVYVENLGVTLPNTYPSPPEKVLVGVPIPKTDGSSFWSVMYYSDLQNSYIDSWNTWVQGLKTDSSCVPPASSSLVSNCEYYIPSDITRTDGYWSTGETVNGYTKYTCDLGKSGFWSKNFNALHFWYGADVFVVIKPLLSSSLQRECYLVSTSKDIISQSPVVRAVETELTVFKGSYASSSEIDSNGYYLKYPMSALGNINLVVWADTSLYPTVKEVIVPISPRITSASFSSSSVSEKMPVSLFVDIVNDGAAGDVWLYTDVRGFEGQTRQVYLAKGAGQKIELKGLAPAVTTDTPLCGVAKAAANTEIKSNQICYTVKNIASEENIDIDSDGVPDAEDACKLIYGPLSNKGCPLQNREEERGSTDSDIDRDGVPNEADDCPSEFGVSLNNGCPVTDDQLPRQREEDEEQSYESQEPLRIPLAVIPFALGIVSLAGGLATMRRH